MIVQQLQEALREIDSCIPRTHVTLGRRAAYALALFDLCHEHAKAILSLLEANLCASALALMRSCLEAYVRGCWLLYGANEGEVRGILNGRDSWADFATMLRSLDEMGDTPRGYYSKRYKRAFSLLSGLTHGGWQQLVKRLASGKLEYRPEEGEIQALSSEAVAISCMANLRICDILGNEDAASAVGSVMRRLFLAQESSDKKDSHT